MNKTALNLGSFFGADEERARRQTWQENGGRRIVTDDSEQYCREGARRSGRIDALMYDLSSLAPGQADRLIDDWKKLLRDTRLTCDPAYLRPHGKPLPTRSKE